MKIDLYKDGIGFITDDVSTIKASQSNMNEANRMKFVTDLAAVSRGKHESNSPENRYLALLREASPTHIAIANTQEKVRKSPSRPLEFLPVALRFQVSLENVFFYSFSATNEILFETSLNNFYNMIAKFSYIVGDKLYTNMRALLNAGFPYAFIPFNTEEELRDFRAFRANIPMFVFNHLITHTALSKEAQSDRVTKNPNYWLPHDFRDRVYTYQKANPLKDCEVDDEVFEKLKARDILSLSDKKEIVDYLLENFSQNEIQLFLKNLGYKKEIYQRAMLEFRYKEVVMTAWNNNPLTFEHFMIEREAYPHIHTSWVQEQTRLLAEGIRSLLENRCLS